MIYLFIFVTELFSLFILSKLFTKSLSMLIFKLCRSETLTIHLIAIIFFPGVLVHELSHFIFAKLLLIKTGKIDFFPKLTGNSLKLGSVSMEKANIAKRMIVGIAPVMVGMTILFLSIYLFFAIYLRNDLSFIFVALFLIGAFQITNTMFSSKKDMEGTIEILATLLIISVVLYILGVRPSISFEENAFTKNIFEAVRISTIFMSAPIAIDLVILGLIRVFRRN